DCTYEASACRFRPAVSEFAAGNVGKGRFDGLPVRIERRIGNEAYFQSIEGRGGRARKKKGNGIAKNEAIVREAWIQLVLTKAAVARLRRRRRRSSIGERGVWEPRWRCRNRYRRSMVRAKINNSQQTKRLLA